MLMMNEFSKKQHIRADDSCIINKTLVLMQFIVDDLSELISHP